MGQGIVLQPWRSASVYDRGAGEWPLRPDLTVAVVGGAVGGLWRKPLHDEGMEKGMSASLQVGSLGDRLSNDLRSRIIRGEFARGERLVEEAIAKEYEVSRGPVRDAFARLVGEQLVESRRQGVFVRGMDAREVSELYALRAAIEPLAVRLAIAAAESKSAWRGAELALEGMEASADASRWADYARHDLDFHTEIYRNSGNRRLWAVWEQYLPSFGVMMQMTNERDADLHPSAGEHREILDALKEQKADLVLRVLERHLAGSERRMLEALGRSVDS